MPTKIKKTFPYFNQLSSIAFKRNITRETIAYKHFLSRIDYLEIIVYPITGKLPPALITYRNLCKSLTTYCGLTLSEYDYLLSIEKMKESLWEIEPLCQ